MNTKNINSIKQNKIVASLDDFDEDEDNKFSKSNKKDNKSSRTPVLDSFSKDLTKMAEEGKIDPIVGREKEILRVSQILSRRKKNNPILIGEPGVGKSSIAEGLALRIVQRKVSRVLFNKRIVTLDLASMVAGTKYRGQFEERIKALMAELEKEPNVILFIDEIHTMIGAGGASGSLDASNMFKPALSRGELQIIGATTLDEYRKHIEKDGALERRFQKVLVEPATEEETLQILNNIKENYENHHSVKYTPEALKACVTLTARYVQDRFLPDKAIDALDEAGSHVHISNINVPKEIIDIESEIAMVKEEKQSVVKSQRYEDAAKLRDKERHLNDALDKARLAWEAEQKKHRQTVTEDNIAQVVSMITGIPLHKITTNENLKLSKMAPELKGKVIGQDDAVNKIVRSIQRSRIGLADPNKPIFVGMLIGNSGVGKTELARQLAKYMFDSEDALIRLDMSEYMEKIAASRISGAAPGYVGYDEGSELLNKVRTKPYSVILLDEIEKAHQDIYNLFLQVFDDGYMTDSHGRKVSFKNTVILMTSNVGTKEVKDFGNGVGFNTKAKEDKKSDNIKDRLEKELKRKFPPEFINRIDDIIYFKDLAKEDILSIVDLELVKSVKRSGEIGYKITIDDKLKEHLVKVGYDPQYGARPMKRAIQRWIDDYLTDFILENSPAEGTSLAMSYDFDKDSTSIIATPPEPKTEVHIEPEDENEKVEKPKKTRKKKSE
jgi:ATP-dependent Clp protease ATP-binding subunit ClpC